MDVLPGWLHTRTPPGAGKPARHYICRPVTGAARTSRAAAWGTLARYEIVVFV